jgi:hypothetical protein
MMLVSQMAVPPRNSMKQHLAVAGVGEVAVDDVHDADRKGAACTRPSRNGQGAQDMALLLGRC